MASSFKRLGQSELLPRYIFAESLVARRRVLEIGAVASTLGESAKFLHTRGARLVVAADADLNAVQAADAAHGGPTVRFRALLFDDLEAGSFDLVMVADLVPYVRAPELLKELARVVAKNGYLIGGLRNPAGLALAHVVDPDDGDAPPTFGQLHDALTAHFKSIEVATQAPVLGYQLAFEGSDGLQIDGSLAGHSEAAYFVVIAGHDAVRSFEPTWVQLPPEPLAYTGGKLEDAATRARDWKERSDRLKESLTRKSQEFELAETRNRQLTEMLSEAREVAARLQAQLEASKQVTADTSVRDALTLRLQRLEFDLLAANQRVIDIDGRLSQSLELLRAAERAQQDAVTQALAAQEQARLDRARKEELEHRFSELVSVKSEGETSNQKLRDDLATQFTEVRRLQSALDESHKTRQHLDATLAAAKERELALAQAHAQSQEAAELLQRALDEAKRSLQQVEARQSLGANERVSLERSLEAQQQAFRSAQAEAERLQSRVTELSRLTQNTEALLAAKDTEIEALSASRQSLDARLQQALAEQAHLKDRAAELEQKWAEARALAESASGERQQLVNRAAELELDARSLLRERDETRASLEALRRDIESGAAVSKQVVAERESLAARVETLTRELAAQRELTDAAESRLQARENELTQLTTERAALQKQVQQAAGENSELQEVRRALQLKVDGTDDQIRQERVATAAMYDTLKEREAELEAAQASVAVLQRKVEDFQSQGESLDARAQRAEQAREEAIAERARLAGDLEATRRRLETAEQAVVQVDAASQERVAAHLAELQRLKATLSARELELTALTEARGQLELERDGLLERQAAQRREHDKALATHAETIASLTAMAEKSALGFAEQHRQVSEKYEAEVTARAALERTLLQLKEAAVDHEVASTQRRGELEAAQKALAEAQAALEIQRHEAREAQVQNDELLGLAQAELTEARAAHARELAEVQKTLQSVEARLTASASELATARSAHEALEQRWSELQTNHRELERERASLQSRVEAVQAEGLEARRALEEQLSNAQRQLEVVRAELAETQAEHAQSLEKATSLADEATTSQRRSAEQQAALELQQTRVAELEIEVQTLKGSLAGTEQQLLALMEVEEQKGALEKTLAQTQQSLNSVREAAAEREVRSRDEFEALQQLQNELQAQLETRTGALEASAAELRALRESQAREVAAAEQRAREANAHAEALEVQRQELQIRLETLSGEQKAFDELLQVESAGRQTAEARVHELEAQLATVQRELDVAQAQHAAQTATAASGVSEAALADLQQQMEQLQARVLTAQRARDEKDALAIRRLGEVQKLMKTNAEQQSANDLLALELKNLQAEKGALEEKLRAAPQAVATPGADLQALRAELAEANRRQLVVEEQLIATQRELSDAQAIVAQRNSQILKLEETQALPEIALDAVVASSPGNDQALAEAVAAREQAETLLRTLRESHRALEQRLTEVTEGSELSAIELSAVRDQLRATMTENQLLERERVRLSGMVSATEQERARASEWRIKAERLQTENERLQAQFAASARPVSGPSGLRPMSGPSGVRSISSPSGERVMEETEPFDFPLEGAGEAPEEIDVFEDLDEDPGAKKPKQ